MRENTTKRALERGETVFGYAMALGSPAACEQLATTGIDFLMLDMQHGGWGPDSVMHGFMAASLGGATPMARVATNDYMQIGRLLDEGALGIIVPLVDTVAQAQAASHGHPIARTIDHPVTRACPPTGLCHRGAPARHVRPARSNRQCQCAVVWRPWAFWRDNFPDAPNAQHRKQRLVGRPDKTARAPNICPLLNPSSPAQSRPRGHQG